MKRNGYHRTDAENVFRDPRLDVFQGFTSLLLRRLDSLEERKETDDFESLSKELLLRIGDDRRHHVDVVGDEIFLVECGLADELLQTIDWPGRDWWKANLLELKIYHTRTVGDRFYHIVDQLIERRRRDDLPLAMILLDALALGFHGRFKHNEADDLTWNRYRNELGTWIRTMLDPRDLKPRPVPSQSSDPKALLPEIPSLRKWWTIAVVSAVAMLVFSHFVWWRNVEPLHEMINRAAFESTGNAGAVKVYRLPAPDDRLNEGGTDVRKE